MLSHSPGLELDTGLEVYILINVMIDRGKIYVKGTSNVILIQLMHFSEIKIS